MKRRMPKVHDYTTMEYGRECSIRRVFNNGKNIEVVGSGYGLRSYDSLLLKNEGRPELYLLEKVRYFYDNPDKWGAIAERAEENV